MAGERDYLGEKLRLVERAREDAYFRQVDRELLENMRRDEAEATEESERLQQAFSPILVPIDFSPYSTKALNYAADIAERFEASLIVLHVIDRETGTRALRQRLTESSEAPDEEIEAAIVDEREQAYRDLHAFIPSRVADYPHELRVVVGHPFERIIETAVRENVALIVLGTHGRTGLSRVVMGSIAERVGRLAPCPVMMVKAPTEEEEGWLERFYETFIPSSEGGNPHSTLI